MNFMHLLGKFTMKEIIFSALIMSSSSLFWAKAWATDQPGATSPLRTLALPPAATPKAQNPEESDISPPESSSLENETKKITRAEGNFLKKKFIKAQAAELKMLEKKLKHEYRDLESSIKQKYKEWDRSETEARHTFREEHKRGDDQRAYIQDYLSRRLELKKANKEELEQKALEHKKLIEHLKQEQTQRSRKFKQSIEKGLRPSQDLFPDLP